MSLSPHVVVQPAGCTRAASTSSSPWPSTRRVTPSQTTKPDLHLPDAKQVPERKIETEKEENEIAHCENNTCKKDTHLPWLSSAAAADMTDTPPVIVANTQAMSKTTSCDDCRWRKHDICSETNETRVHVDAFDAVGRVNPGSQGRRTVVRDTDGPCRRGRLQMRVGAEFLVGISVTGHHGQGISVCAMQGWVMTRRGLGGCRHLVEGVVRVDMARRGNVGPEIALTKFV